MLSLDERWEVILNLKTLTLKRDPRPGARAAAAPCVFRPSDATSDNIHRDALLCCYRRTYWEVCEHAVFESPSCRRSTLYTTDCAFQGTDL